MSPTHDEAFEVHASWLPGPKINYSLGESRSRGGDIYTRVFVTVGRPEWRMPMVQSVELPDDEAKRLIRLMSADLY